MGTQMEEAAVRFAEDTQQRLEDLRAHEAGFGKVQDIGGKDRESSILQSLVEQQELRVDPGQVHPLLNSNPCFLFPDLLKCTVQFRTTVNVDPLSWLVSVLFGI